MKRQALDRHGTREYFVVTSTHLITAMIIKFQPFGSKLLLGDKLSNHGLSCNNENLLLTSFFKFFNSRAFRDSCLDPGNSIFGSYIWIIFTFFFREIVVFFIFVTLWMLSIVDDLKFSSSRNSEISFPNSAKISAPDA